MKLLSKIHFFFFIISMTIFSLDAMEHNPFAPLRPDLEQFNDENKSPEQYEEHESPSKKRQTPTPDSLRRHRHRRRLAIKALRKQMIPFRQRGEKILPIDSSLTPNVGPHFGAELAQMLQESIADTTK